VSGQVPAPARRRYGGLVGAVLVTALLALYVGLVVVRAVQLIGTGKGIGVGLGVALLVLPLLVIALVAREWWLAVDVRSMADALDAQGGLPVDDLPRSPGGRIDRDAARERFAAARQEVEATPGDWRTWYHLAFAYDAAGDRRAARGALRTASRLHRGKGAPPA
jgi:cytochrome c-type biogenesis protein CcmH/NrfG